MNDLNQTGMPGLAILLSAMLLLLSFWVDEAHAQVSLEASAGLTTEVSGSLHLTLDGHWTNLGTFNADSSTVTFTGDSTQAITNAAGAFYNLILNKHNGAVLAAGPFTVAGTLTLTRGDLDLNGQVVTLGPDALLAETPGNTVRGTDGYLETTRVLNAPNADNVAGLGFEITSTADLGSTVIRRGHAAQAGSGNTSILRYFDVVPTNNAGLGATVVFHYDESELAGQDESLLALYRSEDGGGSWTAEGGSADGVANTITLGGVDALWRWTAAQDPLGTPANTPPSDVVITAPLDAHPVGTPVAVSATFTDPDTGDTHTARWDWGDTTQCDTENPDPAPDACAVDQTGDTVSGTHTYTAPGVYTLTLAVTDAAGTTATGTFLFVVVYDPAAGFVTGGGWIDSPEGAYVADTTLTGRAHFGFVSKYKKGQSTPDGSTRFQLQVADLDFTSTSYDWLVISGPHAKYKGEGTINDAGTYGFMLTATDGDLTGGGGTDLFRIKIWDKANGDALVYDNQMGESDDSNAGTALGGGSIKIHSSGGGNHKVGDAEEEASLAALSEMPTTYALESNYPNPFNPETTLPFALPEAGHVKLVVYDVLGREVARLIDGPMAAGRHTVRFDAARLPSGSYFYRLEAGSFNQVRQMLLVK